MSTKAFHRFVAVPTGLILLTGCVTFKPAAQTPSAEARVLAGVPLTEFGTQNCGAASLSAVMRYWGLEISVDELDRTLPKAANGGVLSLDMALAARDRGFATELTTGSGQLIAERIEAGQPLILMLQVFDSIGTDKDLFHYVIVDGLDTSRDLVRVQYGDGRARWVPMARLFKAWEDTGLATLILRPASEPELGGDPIRYGVALEEAGRLREAEAIYRHLLETSPRSSLLWVNLGNVLSTRGLHPEAERAYREALDLDPGQHDALNNLAWLLLETDGDLQEAQQLVSRAVALGGPDPYLALDTMGRILLVMEQCTRAGEVFELALRTAPADSTARGWILYGLALARHECEKPNEAMRILEPLLQRTSDADLNEAIKAELQALRPQ